MGRRLVTGATGLIGSQIAAQLRAAGHDVVALVRDGTSSSELEALGVRISRGDLSDGESILRSMDGCDGVFHSAAALGADLSIERATAINVAGTRALLQAARVAGVRRVVAIGSPAAFDGSMTLTERSSPVPDPVSDPYAATKRGAYLACMDAVADGQDVVVALPGATYGPCPMAQRVLVAYGADQRIADALRGVPARHLPMVAPWSCTLDVAGVAIAAFERGISGSRYLALGAPDCVMTIADLVNLALEQAGSSHRVDEVGVDELDDQDVVASYPAAVVERCRMPTPEPVFDATATSRSLDYEFVSVRDRVLQTVEWLRSVGVERTAV